MKKTKYIAATLALAVSLMGAGYAAWGDTVNIGNIVKTSHMKVEFVQEDTHPYIAGLKTNTSDPKFIFTNLIHTPKITYVDIQGLYPGATALVETRIKNLGSVSAIGDYAEVILSNDTSDIIKEKLIIRGEIIHFRPVPGGGAQLIEAAALPVDTGVPLKDLAPELTKMIQGMVLLPGDFVTFDVTDEYKQQLAAIGGDFAGYDTSSQNSLYFTLPSSAGNETKNLPAKFEIKLNFKQ